MTEIPMTLRIGIRIVAALLLVVAIVIYRSHSSVSTTVAHNREIQESFLVAHSFIKGLMADQDRLPSESEFQAWRDGFPHQAFSPRHVMFAPFEEERTPPEVLFNFGMPDGERNYVLSFWHGEWMDYSPSWTEETNLVLDEAEFFFFGSHARDSLAWAALSGAMLVISLFVAPSRRIIIT